MCLGRSDCDNWCSFAVYLQERGNLLVFDRQTRRFKQQIEVSVGAVGVEATLRQWYV